MLDESSPPAAAGAPIQLARPELPSLEDFAAALEPVWERAHISNFGPKTRELERIASAYTGLPHILSAANADLGLTLAIAALQLPRGTQAIVPSFTFPSTLHAALWNGLEPVFADVDPHTWTATPESIAPALERSEPGLILATHCFLATADAPGLERTAADRGIPLVLDAAQAYASWIGDRHAGAYGDASVFSLSATKVVTSGEGGLAAFRRPEHAARFERLRTHGMTRDHEVVQPGLNAKLDELHATLGCLTLPKVEEHADALLTLVGAYAERLAGSAATMQAIPPGTRPTPSQLVVDVGDRREHAAEALEAQGIGTRRYFRPLHLMAPFATLARPELPVTEHLGRSLLTLPLHLRMTVADVDRVCDALLAAL